MLAASNLLLTTVVGRLGADPEIPEEGKAAGKVAKFSVAVNQYNNDTKTEETVWVRCSAWDRQKDYVMANLKNGKGAMVWVTGTHSVYEGASGAQDQLNVKGIGIAGNFMSAESDDGEDW